MSLDNYRQTVMRDAWVAMLNTRPGRRVLTDILHTAGYFDRRAFMPGNPDQTAFNCGVQEVNVRIAETIRSFSTNALQIMEEEREEDIQNATTQQEKRSWSMNPSQQIQLHPLPQPRQNRLLLLLRKLPQRVRVFFQTPKT